MTGAYLLKYVCKFCGCHIATFNVRSERPAVLSVCDKRECREAASLAYKS